MMIHNKFSSLGFTVKTGVFLGVAATSHHNSPPLEETRNWDEFNSEKSSGSIISKEGYGQ